jgi:hypothetical protein
MYWLANYADGVISKKQVNNIENNQGLPGTSWTQSPWFGSMGFDVKFVIFKIYILG